MMNYKAYTKTKSYIAYVNMIQTFSKFCFIFLQNINILSVKSLIHTSDGAKLATH